jgi:hypothetical protein
MSKKGEDEWGTMSEEDESEEDEWGTMSDEDLLTSLELLEDASDNVKTAGEQAAMETPQEESLDEKFIIFNRVVDMADFKNRNINKFLISRYSQILQVITEFIYPEIYSLDIEIPQNLNMYKRILELVICAFFGRNHIKPDARRQSFYDREVYEHEKDTIDAIIRSDRLPIYEEPKPIPSRNYPPTKSILKTHSKKKELKASFLKKLVSSIRIIPALEKKGIRLPEKKREPSIPAVLLDYGTYKTYKRRDKLTKSDTDHINTQTKRKGGSKKRRTKKRLKRSL